MPGSTPRLNQVLPIGADAVSEIRESITANADILDDAVLYIPPGTLAAMPAASAVPPGSMYYATDVGMVFLAVGGSGSSAGLWVNSMFSPGDLKCSGISSPPNGWLLCNGQAVSRTTYAFLFGAIGTSWGAGDESTTFNVPDLRGRVPLGAGTGTAAGASAWALGSQPTSGAGGEETHELSAGEMPTHTHGVSDPEHSHGITEPAGGEGHLHSVGATFGGAVFAQSLFVDSTRDSPSGSGSDYNVQSTLDGGPLSTGDETSFATTGITVNDAATGITIDDAGSNEAHNNVQPVSVVNWFIKT